MAETSSLNTSGNELGTTVANIDVRFNAEQAFQAATDAAKQTEQQFVDSFEHIDETLSGFSEQLEAINWDKLRVDAAEFAGTLEEDMVSAFDDISASVQKSTATIDLFTTRLGALKQAQAEIGIENFMSAGENAGGEDTGGDFSDSGGFSSYRGSRGFSAVGSLVRQAGAPGLGTGIADVGRIMMTINLVDRLAESVGGMGESVANSTGIIGALTEAIVGADAGLASITLGVAGLSLILAPVIASVALLVGGYESLISAEQPMLQNLEAFTKNVDALYKVLQSDSTQQATTQVQAAQAEEDRIRAEIAGLEAQQAAIKNVEGAGPLGAIGADFAETVKGIFDQSTKDANEKLKTLQTELANTTGKVTEFSLALSDSTVKAQDAIDKVQQANKELEAYYALISSGTTQQIKDAITKNSVDQANQQTLIETTNNKMKDLQGKADALKNNDISRGVKPEDDPYYTELIAKHAELATTLDSEKQHLTDLQGTYKNLTDALPQVQKIEDIEHGVQEQKTLNDERQKLITDGSAKELQQLQDKNKQEYDDNVKTISLLQMAQASATDPAVYQRYQDDIDKYQAKQNDLMAEYNMLSDNTLPGLIAGTKAVDDSFKNLMKGFSDAGKIIDEAATTFAKLADNQAKFNEAQQIAQQDYNTKTQRQNDDFNEKQTQAAADFKTKLGRQNTDFATKHNEELQTLYDEANAITTKATAQETKLRTDLAAKEEQINTDLADKISSIRDKEQADELDAASHLDARRVAQIQRQADQQVNDAEKTADKQKTQLEKDTATKIDDLQKSSQAERDQRLAAGLEKLHDEQDQYNVSRQRQIDDFNEKQQLAQQQHDTQMAREQEDFNTKESRQRDNFIQQQNALSSHLEQMLGIENHGLGLIGDAWQTFFSNLKTPTAPSGQTVTNQQFQSASATSPNAYSQFQTPYANSTVTSTQYQAASNNSPDAYSQFQSSYQQGPSTALGQFGQSAGSLIGGLLSFIPGFADGLDNVPSDNFFAKLHKNERVLTAQENAAYTNNSSSKSIHIAAGAFPITVSSTGQANDLEAQLMDIFKKLAAD